MEPKGIISTLLSYLQRERTFLAADLSEEDLSVPLVGSPQPAISSNERNSLSEKAKWAMPERIVKGVDMADLFAYYFLHSHTVHFAAQDNIPLVAGLIKLEDQYQEKVSELKVTGAWDFANSKGKLTTPPQEFKIAFTRWNLEQFEGDKELFKYFMMERITPETPTENAFFICKEIVTTWWESVENC